MYKSTEMYEMNSPCNAKEELLRILGEASKLRPEFIVKCADITIIANTVRSLEQFGQYEDPNPVEAKLHTNKTGNDLKEFLDKLNAVKNEDEYSLEMLISITDEDDNCHFEY